MIVYLICYLTSFLLARSEHFYMSGFALMIAAVYLYAYDYIRSRNLIHLRGLFSLFWVGGQSLACLKLSRLQTQWLPETWLSFLVAFAGFWIVFEVLKKGSLKRYRLYLKQKNPPRVERPVYQSIIIVTLISLFAFLLEALVLGYIPFFVRGVPHAYSEFHISGVHYFTVSCVLVPSLAVLYFFTERRRIKVRKKRDSMVLLMTGISLLIPILCVSRFQFLFAVILALFTYVAIQGEIRLSYAAAAGGAMLVVYVILTFARSHDVEYLNGIFEMKNRSMPIFITQPYMYIANNYENFDCLVFGLDEHAYGLRSLFPVWALTGLKFLAPSLVSFPLYVNKEELTTLTLFYDAYYDFGVFGVCLFSCGLGALSHWLVFHYKRMKNPIGYLFYAQVAAYMALSFFTTWFSNPATWFYLVVTGLLAFYYQRNS